MSDAKTDPSYVLHYMANTAPSFEDGVALERCASAYDAKCAELAEAKRCAEDYYTAMKGADAERQSAQWKAKDECAALRADVQRLRGPIEAMLLFHGGGRWEQSVRDKWLALTGSNEATTKVLCDFARAALAADQPAAARPEATLFEAIKHGDEKHQAWLKQAIADHFAGRPVLRPDQTDAGK